MSRDELPGAIWEGVFVLLGVPVHCALLDDGRRVADADDVDAVFARMATGDTDPGVDPSELARFSTWLHGAKP